MAIEWRGLRASDVPGACDLSRIAGWNQTEADWLGYLAFDSGGCLAVLVDGELAGTATSIRYGERVGWIGMVLVHPRHRRLGLGTELLSRTVRYLREKGTRSIKLDATPIGRTVYLPLGFRDEFEVTRFEGHAPEMPAERAAAPLRGGAEPFDRGDVASVAELDAQAFGARRDGVLMALSGRDPELCFVVRDAGRISGYLIARKGREAVQLGPIVALHPATAERLFDALFRAARGRRLFLDLPAPNHAGGEILARNGFRVQRSFTRMTLGENSPPDRVTIVYGTSGAEKG